MDVSILSSCPKGDFASATPSRKLYIKYKKKIFFLYKKKI